MGQCSVINCGKFMDPKNASTYAISRRDGKTKICNDCGRDEALEDLKKKLEKEKEKKSSTRGQIRFLR